MAAHIFSYFAVLLFPIFVIIKKKQHKFETMFTRHTSDMSKTYSSWQTPYCISAPVLSGLIWLQLSKLKHRSVDSKWTTTKSAFTISQQMANRGVTRYFMNSTWTSPCRILKLEEFSDITICRVLRSRYIAAGGHRVWADQQYCGWSCAATLLKTQCELLI